MQACAQGGGIVFVLGDHTGRIGLGLDLAVGIVGELDNWRVRAAGGVHLWIGTLDDTTLGVVLMGDLVTTGISRIGIEQEPAFIGLKGGIAKETMGIGIIGQGTGLGQTTGLDHTVVFVVLILRTHAARAGDLGGAEQAVVLSGRLPAQLIHGQDRQAESIEPGGRGEALGHVIGIGLGRFQDLGPKSRQVKVPGRAQGIDPLLDPAQGVVHRGLIGIDLIRGDIEFGHTPVVSRVIAVGGDVAVRIGIAGQLTVAVIAQIDIATGTGRVRDLGDAAARIIQGQRV